MNKNVHFYFYVHIYKKDSFLFSSTYLVKIIHKLSYSVLSIILSCKDFLYNLSKDLIVCRPRSYCFLYLLFLFMINLCNTSLPNDRVQAIPADVGKIIKPIPVIDRVIEVDVAAMITILSTDSNTVFRVLSFLYFFLDLWFLFLNYVIISLMLVTWLIKLLRSFIFFSNRFSKSLFSNNGADGYNLSVFWSVYSVKITLICVIKLLYECLYKFA